VIVEWLLESKEESESILGKNFIWVLKHYGGWMNHLKLHIKGEEIEVKRGVVMGDFLASIVFDLFYALVHIKMKYDFDGYDIYYYTYDTTFVIKKIKLFKLLKNFVQILKNFILN